MPSTLDALPVDDFSVAQDAIRSYVLERLTESAEDDNPFKANCMDNIGHYAAIAPPGWNYPWRLILPEAMMTVQDSAEQLMNGLFLRDTPFALRALDPEEDFEEYGGDQNPLVARLRELMDKARDVKREMLSEAFKRELREINYKLKTYDWFFEALLHANSVMFTWAMPVLEYSSGTGGISGRARVRPEMYQPSRMDLYPAPIACHQPDIQRMPYFGIDIYRPVEETRLLAKLWRWENANEIKGIVDLNSDSGNAIVRGQQDWGIYRRLQACGFATRSSGSAGHGVTEYAREKWFFETVPGTDYCRGYAVVVNENLLMCCRPNTWGFAHKPLADVRWRVWDQKVWQGLSLIDQIAPYVNSLNIANAQQATDAELKLYPPRLVNPSSLAAGEEDFPRLRRPEPGAIYNVTNAAGISRLDTGGADFEIATRITESRNGIQRASKLPDSTRGIVTKEGDPGTFGALQLLSDASKRGSAFQLKFGSERGVNEQLNQALVILQRSMTEPRKIRPDEPNEILTGAGYGNQFTVDPEDVQGRYDVFAVGMTESIDTPEKLSALLEVLNLPRFANNPEVQARINDWKLLKLLADQVAPGMLTRVARTESEMQQIQQQNAQKAVAMALMQRLTMGQPKASTTPGRGAPAARVARPGMPAAMPALAAA